MVKTTNSLSRIAIWILMGLLLVGLAGFGIGSFGSGGSTVGRVGDEVITADAYARALQDEMAAQQRARGEAVGLQELLARGTDRQVLDGLVARAALANEAQLAGISVGDAEVARQIRQIQAFQGIDGSFDRLAYEAYLDRSGQDADTFEEQVREDTARGLLQQAIIGGITAPDAITGLLTAYQTESRAATLARVTEDDLRIGALEPTEAQLGTFYEENSDRFTRPETREVTYAWVTPEMLLDEVEISQEALQNLYDERADEFVQPERRLLEQLIFQSEQAARQAADALVGGQVAFADLVAERDLTLADVDLGEVARDDLPPAAAEAVFADDEAEFIGPVDVPLGYAVFRVNAVLEASETALEDVRDELSVELRLDAARRLIDDSRSGWTDLLVGGATLEDLAAETDLRLGEMDWTQASEDTIAGYDAFGEVVEVTEPGDFPEFVDLSDGGLFALRVEAVRPPALPPLDEIAGQVREAWRAAQVRDALAVRAREIVAGLEDRGDTLEDLDLPLATETALRRRDPVPGAPPTLVSQLFQLRAPGDIVVIPAAEAAWIVRLDAIEPGTRGTPETAMLRQVLGAQLGQSIQGDLFEAFGQAMQQDLGISLNRQMINAVHASFP